MEYALILLLVLALSIVLLRHIRAKRQIKNVIRQMRGHAPQWQSISVELFDKDIGALALEINQLITEKNKTLLHEEKINQYLKCSIADISHDMRTPLTSAIGYLQLLARSDLNDDQCELLNTALDKSQYLRELLSDFFELSALEADDIRYNQERIDLSYILSETILDNSNEFEQKQISPIFEMTDKTVYIIGNAGLLQRAIQNLISNCLKYSYGDVNFTIVESETVRLIATNPVDNAEQIDIARIFDRFYKADYSRTGQGAGLGLSITKLLVEKMNGTISAYMDNNIIAIQIDFPKMD